MTLPTTTGRDGYLPPTQQQLQESQDTSAATTIAAQAMAIVKDTSNITLIQTKEPLEYERHKSSAKQPVLAPLSSLRTSSPSYDPTTDNSWLAIKEQLVQDLPPDINKEFAKQMGLPAAKRSKNFSALDQVFSAGAKGLSWLQQTASFQPVSAQAVDRANNYGSSALTALNGSIDNAHATAQEASNFLQTVGPNYPRFDQLNPIVQQLGNLADALQNAVKDYTATPQPAGIKEKMTNLSNQANNFSDSINSKTLGDELMILQQAASALALAAEAVSLQGNVSAPLLLTTKLASIGANGGNESAFAGKGFQAVTEGAAEGIKNLYLQDGNRGQGNFLTSIMSAVLTMGSAAGGMLGKEGIGSYLSEQQGEGQAATGYSTELALHLLTSSGALDIPFGVLGKLLNSGGSDGDNGQALGNGASLAFSLFLTAAAANSSPSSNLSLSNLMESLSSYFQPKMDDVSTQVNQQAENNSNDSRENQNSGGGDINALSISGQQMQLAWQNNQWDEATQILLSDILQSANTNEAILNDNLQDMQNNVQVINDAINSGTNDKLNPMTHVEVMA